MLDALDVRKEGVPGEGGAEVPEGRAEDLGDHGKGAESHFEADFVLFWAMFCWKTAISTCVLKAFKAFLSCRDVSGDPGEGGDELCHQGGREDQAGGDGGEEEAFEGGRSGPTGRRHEGAAVFLCGTSSFHRDFSLLQAFFP